MYDNLPPQSSPVATVLLCGRLHASRLSWVVGIAAADCEGAVSLPSHTSLGVGGSPHRPIRHWVSAPRDPTPFGATDPERYRKLLINV